LDMHNMLYKQLTFSSLDFVEEIDDQEQTD